MSAVQASKESDTKHRVLKGGEVRRRKQLQSLGVVAGTNRGLFKLLIGPVEEKNGEGISKQNLYSNSYLLNFSFQLQ